MKAKTFDNRPYGFDTCIYDNEDYPMGYCVEDLPNKERADAYTNSFNSALSSHVAQEAEQLLAEIDRLKKEVKKFEKENDRLRVAYKSLERKLNVASESLKEANEFLNDPKKLGEYIVGM